MPLAIDLFCGLGGWSEALLAEGYEVVGFDIEQHRYPKRIATASASQKSVANSCKRLPGAKGGKVSGWPHDGVVYAEVADELDEYPGQLVLQDVTTLHGSQFKNAALIVASPPCQEYSYMAMPWSLAKEKARKYESGELDVKDLTRLFDACFRIQREASEAAGHHIPMIVENVRGAQKWVGRAKWAYGSFCLWGDVPALMPITLRSHTKIDSPHLRLNDPSRANVQKLAATVNGAAHETRGVKPTEHEGMKQHGSGPEWFDNGICRESSKSNSRKAASAMIAKIPFPLAQHIARSFWP